MSNETQPTREQQNEEIKGDASGRNTTAKHTPGPWEARRGDLDSQAYREWDIFADRARSGCKLPAQTIGPDAEANAYLIAAAPELLDSLKEMLNQYSQTEETGWRKRMHDDARAVIAKAEGLPVPEVRAEEKEKEDL